MRENCWGLIDDALVANRGQHEPSPQEEARVAFFIPANVSRRIYTDLGLRTDHVKSLWTAPPSCTCIEFSVLEARFQLNPDEDLPRRTIKNFDFMPALLSYNPDA